MQDPTEVVRKIKAIRARVPDATDEEILSFLDQEEGLPSAAPVDRTDQTIRNPNGKDPLVKYGLPAAKLYATVAGGVIGGGVGNKLATKAAGAAGRGILGRMGIGAAAGVAGGMGARATGNVVSGRNPVEGLLKPANVGVDAALGAALPAVGGVVGGIKKLAGKSPKLTEAETLERVLSRATKRGGYTPEQMEASLRAGSTTAAKPSTATGLQTAGGAQGAFTKGFKPQSHSVVDMDPQLQGLASDAARYSAQAERQLQEFASSRANVPAWGVVDDITTTLGGVNADVNVGTKAMKQAIKKADRSRLQPVLDNYKDPIMPDVAPVVAEKVTTIFEEIPSTLESLVKRARLSGQPIEDYVQRHVVGYHNGEAVYQDVVTLKGLNELKKFLDKSIRAGRKAADGVNGLPSADMSNLLAMEDARAALMDLPLEGIPGAKEYKAALAASSAERKVADQLKVGADAAKNKVSPEEAAEILKGLAPKEADAFRAGLAGHVKRKVAETGSATGILKNQNLAQKIKDAAANPAAAEERLRRAPVWEAMQKTNKAQETIQPPRFSLSGEEAVGEGAMAGYGSARGVGGIVGGDPGMAKTGLLTAIGRFLTKGATARTRAAQEKAWERIAPWLSMQPGDEAAEMYRNLLREFGNLKRARTIRSGTIAGAAAGANAGRRE